MARLNPTGAPVETKTVAAGAYGSITLVVMWILTNYVFHGHIPPDLETFLPGFVAMVVATAAGWMAHHTPRPEEVVAVVRRELGRQVGRPQPPSQVTLV